MMPAQQYPHTTAPIPPRGLQAVPAEAGDRAAPVQVPPGLTAMYRLPWAVAVAPTVWADVIAWPHPAAAATRRHQSQECRLVDLLWMLTVTADATTARPGRVHRFSLWCVPTSQPSGRSRRVRLAVTITCGPDGLQVATVTAAPARLSWWRRAHADTAALAVVVLMMFGAPVLALLSAGGR